MDSTGGKKTIVLGLGNPLMGDEGIGQAVIKKLQTRQTEFPNAEFVDAGTGGMNILHLIAGKDKAVIIDCALMQTAPGTIKRFTPEQVQSVKKLTHRSLHEADILKVIDLAGQLGQCPDEIVFFGIEPQALELREKLSPALNDRLDEYAEQVAKELCR